MRRPGGLVALAAGGGDLREDAAPVVRAHLALDEAGGLEAADDAREGALGEVDAVVERLHPARVVARSRQALEHLVLAHTELVLLQRALECARRASVALAQLVPAGDQLVDRAGGQRVGRRGHRGAHYSKRLQLMQLHLMYMQ